MVQLAKCTLHGSDMTFTDIRWMLMVIILSLAVILAIYNPYISPIILGNQDKIVWLIDGLGEPTSIDLYSNINTVLISDRVGHIYMLSEADGSKIQSFTIASKPQQIIVEELGKHVYYDDAITGTITAVSLADFSLQFNIAGKRSDLPYDSWFSGWSLDKSNGRLYVLADSKIPTNAALDISTFSVEFYDSSTGVLTGRAPRTEDAARYWGFGGRAVHQDVARNIIYTVVHYEYSDAILAFDGSNGGGGLEFPYSHARYVTAMAVDCRSGWIVTSSGDFVSTFPGAGTSLVEGSGFSPWSRKIGRSDLPQIYSGPVYGIGSLALAGC
jgi:hypothetical protein